MNSKRWRLGGRPKLAALGGMVALALSACAETVGQEQAPATAQGKAPPTAIDTTEGYLSRRVVEQATVVCSVAAALGDYADTTDVTAALYRVEPAGVSGTEKIQVATVSGSEVSNYVWAVGEDGPRSATFVLQAYRGNVEDGDALGDALIRDVSFGVMTSTNMVDCAFDSRTNSLQEAFDLGKSPIPLAYDTAWVDGATQVRLSLEKTTIDNSSTVTNAIGIFDESGTYKYIPKTGFYDYTLICELLDADGAAIDTQSACYASRVQRGMMIILK